jgi:DNA-binding Lrp family transcriptional regulator
MSAGAFVFLRLDTPDHLVPAVEKIRTNSALAEWFAVDGPYHLAIRIESDPAPRIAELHQLQGLSELQNSKILSVVKTAQQLDPEQMAAFVILELLPDLADDITRSIGDMDLVTACYRTAGFCDAVAIVQGPDLDTVDRVISDKIRMLDGVLRVKEDRIIHLDHL